MKLYNQKIVNRRNSVMGSICCEHLTIGEPLSELETCKSYYGLEDGISIDWMLE